jgi:hypothetical protein
MDAVTGLRDERDWLLQAAAHQAGRGAVARELRGAVLEPQDAEPTRLLKERVQTDAVADQLKQKWQAFVVLALESAPRLVRQALRPQEQFVEDAPLAKELEMVSERPEAWQRALLQGWILAERRVRLAAPRSWRRPEPELAEEQEVRKPLQARPEVQRDDDGRRAKLLPWPAFPPGLRIPRQRQCLLVPEWRGEPLPRRPREWS